jgi:hypothetical protein
LCDISRPSGPHSHLAAQSPYDTSLTGCQISSGFGAKPAAPFSSVNGTLSTKLNTTLQRSPSALSLVTSGSEPPEVERNIGPEHSNEVHASLCPRGREAGMGSLPQDMEHFVFHLSSLSRIPTSRVHFRLSPRRLHPRTILADARRADALPRHLG